VCLRGQCYPASHLRGGVEQVWWGAGVGCPFVPALGSIFILVEESVGHTCLPPTVGCSMFDNILTDLDLEQTMEVAGWAYSSNAQQSTRSQMAAGGVRTGCSHPVWSWLHVIVQPRLRMRAWPAGGVTPSILDVVDNFVTNVANVGHGGHRL
jgi:hypothetical protein